MKVRVQSNSIVSGKTDVTCEVDDGIPPWNIPIVATFIKDDDIQEMTIVSACIGFVKTFTKVQGDGDK